MSYEACNIFKERIKKGLLGPGSDIFGVALEEELISDYPLQRYFTGILFPEKAVVRSQNKADEGEVEAETIEEEVESIEEIKADEKGYRGKTDSLEGLSVLSADTEEKDNEETQLEYKSANQYFPTNMGLTFCLAAEAEKIELEFSFGLYSSPKQADIKIKIAHEDYLALVNNPDFPFKDITLFEDGFMFLKRALKGDKGGKAERSGEYKQFDEFKNKAKNEANLKYLEKLIGRIWKRKHVVKKINFGITNITKPEIIFAQGKIKVGYYAKVYEEEKRKYVKILLANLSEKHPNNRFSTKNEALNSKCMFQVSIKVKSDLIVPYKSYQDLHVLDEEAKTLNFQYREVNSYGIGHGCSVKWEGEGKILKTSYLPEYDVKDTINTKNALLTRTAEIDEVLDIYNLSIFSKYSKKTIISYIKQFNLAYKNWIDKQETLLNKEKLNRNTKEIGKELIQNLYQNYERISENIDLLENSKVFECFTLANTAMLIQFILASDTNFSAKGKYLDEIPSEINYNSLEFFKDYDFKNSRIEYRPFQLAFLLLNIKGIIDKNSKERSDIVDLLWFPTGGGKTEAYLAVVAFTILWRRLNNVNFEGTSVIMRYTLRLLTSQQFERSSRLISVLEFLRRSFPEKLKEEPITIGMWIGASSTPNSLKEAKEKLDIIRKEKDNPEKKNVFQIFFCPWCGARIINKNPENSKLFDSFDINKKEFKIKCPNERCCFKDTIPVQVVDEMLYENPPTLLFATVDKFAMLAWRKECYKFFNSLDEKKKPPDLIVQDELHLLSGPLGSITGLYENIIELLCTKGNIKPKIIASTATTRNTKEQVSLLYGGRKVNIFPPSGISYEDSFFARVSDGESKRKYIGFMPTGKTNIDTQLQILAHLLVARLEVYQYFYDNPYLVNNYWTILSYYNSLRDVGRISNKISDEVFSFTAQLQSRIIANEELKFNYYGLPHRTEELTSRIDSSKIKSILNKLETNFSYEKVANKEYGFIDLVLATNMISVGIDISRLNIMLVNGQPRNIAEYIQASSRVARKEGGIVLALLDPNRAREKSYFEHFIPFHQVFYKFIEPLSITPFTQNAIKKMLNNMLIAFVRYKLNLNDDVDAHDFNAKEKDNLIELKTFIKSRTTDIEYQTFERELDYLVNDWDAKIRTANENGRKLKYRDLMKKPDEGIKNDWTVMQSMRDIDSSSFIKILEKNWCKQ